MVVHSGHLATVDRSAGGHCGLAHQISFTCLMTAKERLDKQADSLCIPRMDYVNSKCIVNEMIVDVYSNKELTLTAMKITPKTYKSITYTSHFTNNKHSLQTKMT